MSNNLGRKLSPRKKLRLNSNQSSPMKQNDGHDFFPRETSHPTLSPKKSKIGAGFNHQQTQSILKKKIFSEPSFENAQQIQPKFSGLSGGLIGKNWIRRCIVWLIEWKWFENFVLMVIFLNSLALAVYDYNDRNSGSLRNQIIDVIGKVFTVIFTLECVFKVIGMGFIYHKKAYLRDGWNVLDFMVVIAGLLELIPGGSINLKSLRSLRVLRPLRSINAVPSMRKLVSALIQALPDFANVGVFLLFIFILFAILGCHQYNGIFYNACRLNPSPESLNSWAIDPNQQRVCSTDSAGKYQCLEGTYCGNPDKFGIKPSFDKVINNQKINYGITTFDNLGASLLTVFQIITMDDWAIFMYNILDTDIEIIAVIYFFLMVVFGSFFLLNLILAVIISAFIKIQQQEMFGEIQDTIKKKEDNDEDLNQPEIMTNKLADQSQNPIRTDFEEDFSTPNLNLSQINPLKNVSSNSINQDWDSGNKLNHSEMSLVSPYLNLGNSTNNKNRDTIYPSDLDLTNFAGTSKQVDYQKLLDNTSKLNASPKESILKKELQKMIQEKNRPDLSFLRKQGKQRKIIDLFLNGLKNAEFRKQKEDTEAEQEEEQQLQEQNLKDNVSEIKLFESPNKKPIITLEPLQKTTTQKLQEANKIINNSDSKETEDKIGQFLTVQKHKNSQQQFMQEVLEETTQQFGTKTRVSLRQLTTVKLGLKLKRQQNNITDQLHKFMIEHRAEQNKLYWIMFSILKSKWFQLFISLSIVANTLILSMDRYPIPKTQTKKLEYANLGFSIVFLIEMIIKLLGLGIKSYFKDPFNAFDCIIVITSCIDVGFTTAKIKESGSGFTALRAFRLLRIFKLAKSWKRFQQLLKTIGKTLKDVSTFSILLFLLMYTYTLLGMEMFAFQGKFNSDGEVDPINGKYPNANFNGFLDAITTVFIVLTNDGWAAIYFNYYRAVSPVKSTIFFITLIIIGQKIMLNLFLAILLENFDEDSLNQEIKSNFKKKIALEKNTPIKKHQQWFQNVVEYFKKGFKKQNYNSVEQKVGVTSLQVNSFGRISSAQNTIKTSSYDTRSNQSPSKLKRAFSKEMHNEAMLGKSLFIFSNQNKFRELVFNIVNWKRFDAIIILVILVSGIQLALENPLNNPKSKLVQTLKYMDIVTTSIFITEMVMKIISFGFVFNGPTSYLQNSSNLMDFIIVIFSIVSLSTYLDSLKLFKMFRLLRPLRVINKNEGLRIAVKSLFQAIPSMMNIVIIMLLFFVCFGIIAISFFKGQYFYCDQDSIDFDFSLLVIKHKWDCYNAGGQWLNKDDNFDNIFNAMRTLFLLATTSGWADIMYLSMSTTQVDYVNVPNNRQFWCIFFIVFIIVGAFFLLNLFVGVVISTFNRERENIGGNHLLTDKQKEWLQTRLLMLKSKPIKVSRPPDNRFRKFFYKIVAHPYFDNAIFVCIIINTIVLMLKWYQQPTRVQQVTDAINYLFTAVFTLEAIMKLIAYEKSYFKESWNIFDFVVVLATLASVVITANTKVNLKGATTVIRTFRVLRVFRLIKRAKSLNMVFNTFLVTLPAMANTGGLLFLLIYLYSIIGVTLFANLQRNGIFTDTLNFESFTFSFLAMFKVATGDGWNDVLYAVTIDRGIISDCIDNPTYADYVNNNYKPIGCGGNSTAYLFFYSYVLLVNLIFLNLFIAIILQGFDDVQSRESRQLNPDLLENFKEVWSKYDPDATTFIQIYQLKDFLMDLGEPLGWGKSFKKAKFLQDKFIKSLELPVYNTNPSYQFMDVLQQLSLKLLIQEQVTKKKLHNEDGEELEESDFSDEDERKNTDQMEEEIKNEWEKDINKLEYQQTAKNISAVKNVNKNEAKTTNSARLPHKRDSYYTSVHYAAAEVVLNHLKYLVAKRKLAEQILSMSNPTQKDENDEECDQNQDGQGQPNSVSAFNLDLEPQQVRRQSENNVNDEDYKKYNDAISHHSKTQISRMKTNNQLMRRNTSRKLSIISESLESNIISPKYTNKSSKINNSEIDQLIQQELGRKQKYQNSNEMTQSDIEMNFGQQQPQESSLKYRKQPSENLNNLIKSIFNNDQFNELEVNVSPLDAPTTNQRQKIRPPKLKLSNNFKQSNIENLLGVENNDLDLDALQKEVEDLLKHDNSPLLKGFRQNSNMQTLIKRELSKMISRAASKKFIDKVSVNNNEKDQEMKRAIMQDSFHSDYSGMEESSISSHEDGDDRGFEESKQIQFDQQHNA